MKKSVCLLVSILLFVAAPLSSLSSASLTQPWSNKLVDNTDSIASIVGPAAVAGANGETYVAWTDNKESSTKYYGYVQKLDASGNKLWASPARFSTGNIATGLNLASDVNYNLFVGWQDVRHAPTGKDYNLYTQKIDLNGNIKWTGGGVAICTASGSRSNFDLAADGSGGAILAWTDNRSGNNDIYAQKVSSDGAAGWTADGVLVCNAANEQGTQVDQSQVKLIVTTYGEPIICWQDGRGTSGEYDIYAQKLNSSGAAQWAANGSAVCSAANNQYAPKITADNSTGAVVFWQDWGVSPPTIRAQQIDSSGAIQWPIENPIPAGVLVTGSADNDGVDSAVYAGAAGYLVAWTCPNGYANYDIRAQKLNISGVSQWTAKAQYEVCNLPDSNSRGAKLVLDGNGGAIIAWTDDRNTTANNVFVQRKDSAGGDLWTDDGVAFASSATIVQEQLALASDGSSGAVCSWVDYVGGTKTPTAVYLKARRVLSNGSMAWTAGGVELDKAARPAAKKYPRLAANGDPAAGAALGAWVLWEDYRVVDSKDPSIAWASIYAQRVNSSGITQWAEGGIGAAGGSASEYFIPAMFRTTDGMAFEGVPRHIPGTSQQLLLGQKLDDDGAPQWLDDEGKQVPLIYMNVSGKKYYQPCGAPDSTGGGILAWVYEVVETGDIKIYAKAFKSDGSLREGDAADIGVLIGGNNDAYPAMVYMGDAAAGAAGIKAAIEVVINNERAWIVWENKDVNGISNIRVQQTGGTSTSYKWDETVAFSSTNNQYWPDIDKSGAHEAIIVWSEYVSGKYVVKAQKLGYAGAAGAGFSALAPAPQPTESAPTTLWASDVAVSDPTQDAIYPKVSVLPNGAIVIVWQGSDASGARAAITVNPFIQPTFGRPTPNLTDTKIYMQVLTPGGEKILAQGPLEVTTDTDTEYPDVVASGSDSALISWARNNDDVGEVRVSAFSDIPASTTTTTTTTTTTNTTTTTIPSIVIDPTVDRISDSFKFAKKVSLQAESNTLYGRDIQPGAVVRFINRKTGKVIIAKNVKVASDGLSASFDMDMPIKTDTAALGYYDIVVTNPGGGSYTLPRAFTIEYPEGEIFFYPTRLTEASIKAAAPQDRPRVAYSLSVDKEIDLYIYDVRSMRVVYHRRYAAGTYGGRQGYNEILWDGKTDFGTTIANGSYVLQAFSGGKMIGQTYFVVTD